MAIKLELRRQGDRRPTCGGTSALTLASMLTVAVSLSLVRRRADHLPRHRATPPLRWKGGIEFIVFMNPHVDPGADRRGAQRRSRTAPRSASVEFVDKEAAYEEFKQLFARSARADRQRSTRTPCRRASRSAPADVRRGRHLGAGQAVRDQAGRRRGRLRLRDRSGRCSGSRASSRIVILGISAILHGGGRAAHPQHHPHGHVRPPAGDRGHEARRRHQLVHPRAVHAGGPDPGGARRVRGHGLHLGAQTHLRHRAVEQPGPAHLPGVRRVERAADVHLAAAADLRLHRRRRSAPASPSPATWTSEPRSWPRSGAGARQAGRGMLGG